MEKVKKTTRFNQSAITIADLLSKEGASLVIPFGGFLYETAKVLIKHGKSYYSDRSELRLEDFHTALLDGSVNQSDFESFINKPFDLDDYYAVLASCVLDMENEKVVIYSNLMRSLIKSEISSDLRRHFIKSCKELTFPELDFLRNLYINSKNDLMTVGGTQQQVKKILTGNSELQQLTIDKLRSFGFININSTNITSIGESFVSSIFKPHSLSAESIGRKLYTGINVSIISYQLDVKSHNSIASELHEALWAKQIKSHIHLLNNNNVMHSILFSNAGVLMVDDKPIDKKYIESLSKFAKIRPTIRLNLNQDATNNSIEGVDFRDELTLKSTDQLELRKQVQEYLEKIFPNNFFK